MALQTSRFVSRLTRNTLALVLAGGRGTRLRMLTDWRAKPAVPFGGKFRIIDFALSNCVNSGIRRVCVLTQYKSHALIRHVMRGWNTYSVEMGDFVELIPAQQWTEDESWFTGTADAVYQSLDIIESHQPKYVLVLAGDHVYQMDYGEMLADHVNSGADFTIACIVVPRIEAHEFGVMTVDANRRIKEFQEKPDNPTGLFDDPDSALASMGIYMFS
ncbi:MAG: sugar phosphate nucleotidyltransferase, partial [Gammaproteobacteria bacterium]|nr:sugar phosphate nucleotidyltransferase [Gammaproteobacteria bacterium]